MKKTISQRISKGLAPAFMTSLLALIILTPLVSSAQKTAAGHYQQKTFVLVHGAFQAAYAWDEVKTQLTKQGQKVIVIELPGHGNDGTNPAQISLDSYRDKVVAAINATKGKVVLVGHSMGGMVISAVAETIPNKIERLIYLAAFVPQNGQKLMQIAMQDSVGQLGPLLVPSADFTTLKISNTARIPDIFCADGSAEVKQKLLKNYKPEPAIPFNNAISLTTAAYGSVSKAYIHTVNDKALGMPLQNKMVSDAGISKVYSINSSHCPHMSMPRALTTILLEAAQ